MSEEQQGAVASNRKTIPTNPAELRDAAACTNDTAYHRELLNLAADEIERLRAALNKIASCPDESMRLALIAKEALSGKG